MSHAKSVIIQHNTKGTTCQPSHQHGEALRIVAHQLAQVSGPGIGLLHFWTGVPLDVRQRDAQGDQQIQLPPAAFGRFR